MSHEQPRLSVGLWGRLDQARVQGFSGLLGWALARGVPPASAWAAAPLSQARRPLTPPPPVLPPAPARRPVARALAPLATCRAGFGPGLGRAVLLLVMTLQPALAAVAAVVMAPRPSGGLPGGALSAAPPIGAVVGAALAPSAAQTERLLAGPASMVSPGPAGARPPGPGSPTPGPPGASHPGSGVPTPTPPATAPGPMRNAELRALLRDGDLEGLALGCERALAEERYDRLRLLRQRLLSLHPAPQPLPVVLANADVLLGCQQPEAALTVLERISPAAGAERVQWLLLEWRAAYAALDHRRAAFALERLTASRPERLDLLQLPVARRPDGSVVSRPALDLLAEHQRARGFPEAAAALLLASREPGAAGAERRLDAVRALAQLPAQEREALLESALDQAAAAGAWGLVAELLDAQAALPSERARQRRLRLSPRIDDAYGEWRLRRQEPLPSVRQRQLERQLRAPVPVLGEGNGPSRPAPALAPAPAAAPPPPAPRAPVPEPSPLAPLQPPAAGPAPTPPTPSPAPR